MKRLLSAGLLLVWAALGLAQPGGAALRVVEWDATGVHSATDREWFYRSLGSGGQIIDLPSGGGVYPEIEFSETYDEGTHGVYVPILSDVKGSSFSIRVRIRNTNSSVAYAGTLIPEFAELTRTEVSGSPVVPLTVSVGSGSLSIPPLGTQDVTLQIGGLPNFVTVGDFKVSFRAEGNLGFGPPGGPKIGLATSIERRLCVTDGMPVGIQSVVWNDLLDEYACPWAEGESGAADVRQRLLENLHFSGRWFYVGADKSYYSTTTDPNDPPVLLGFDLSKLLNEDHVQWHYGVPGIMDCRDFAMFLRILLEAQGQSSSVRMLTVDDYDPSLNRSTVGIITNLLCPAGFHPAVPSNYQTWTFNFHAVVSQDGQSVFDASVSHRFTPTGAIFENPVNGWPISSWVQTWNSPTNIFGLVRGVKWSTGPDSNPHQVQNYILPVVPIHFLK